MIRFLSATVTLFTAFIIGLTSAHAVEDTWDYSVQVSSAVQASPAQITLSWPQDTNGTPSSYTVYRKAPSDTSWGNGTSLSGSTTTYTDNNVTSGVAYEYQIVKVAGGYNGYGYIETGINVPLVDNRGKLILIVDNTFSTSLATELAQLQQDLTGDGWTVIRHDVNRTDSVTSVKALIQSDYAADPANVKSVFLFGHVPVPYSGQLNPDGHPDHIGAWPADVYYGDIDNDWTDTTVNYVQNVNTDPADAARLTNIPGDGKFDQTEIPSYVELQVGRVDLANMPGRTTWGGPATFPSELDLLRKYLNKDHAFRTRQTNPPRRAILGDYFGIRGGEAFAASGDRNFAPLVGANNIRNLNIEFNDQQGVWVPQLAQNDYLLAYGCGAGSYNSISGLGNAGLYNGTDTPEIYNQNVRGVFNLLFGSWLGDWDHEDDILRAPLANDYGLVSVWSGRPHWFIHPMGLGATIGAVTQLTQNNNGLYQTQINTAQHRIHIALMGDPSLRLHPVVPVSSLTGSASNGGVSLTWGASADSAIVGYHVYRAASANGTFTRLTNAPVTGTSYTDTSAPVGATYMVRAVKLESTTSGSYYNASQAVFWSAASGTTGTTGVGSTTGSTGSTSGGVTATSTPSVAPTTPSSTPAVSTPTPNVVTTTPTPASTAGTSTTTGSAAVTVGPQIAMVPTSAATAGSTIWIDDALPPGAGGLGGTVDTWKWVGSNPSPFSGSLAHRSDLASGLHEHWFGWSNTPLVVNTGEILTTWVYLDPANPPTEIMLSWSTNSSWEHRAYWGADKINRGSGQGHYNAGPLPATGQWVCLQVPASAVGLEGSSVTGMGYSLYDGAATWDASGKMLPTAPGISVSSTTPSTGSTAPLSASEAAFFDDALPPGAGGVGGIADNWNWVSSNPAPYSGTSEHRSNAALGLHEHWFSWCNTPMAVHIGDVLFTYVYLDPANPPSELMLSWEANDGWEHRAYWGANDIVRGSGQGHYLAGQLPATGGWVRLEVPASAVGLVGANVSGMGFALFNGAATWDKTGTFNGSAAGSGWTAVSGANTGSSAGTTSTSSGATTSGGVTSGSSGTGSASGTAGSGSSTSTSSTTNTSGGIASGGVSSSGSTASTSSTTSTTSTGSTTSTSVPAANEVAFFADALPAGAGGAGGNVDTWSWVTSNPTPYSGASEHVSGAASGLHEHWFAWCNSPMAVHIGDVLFTYVYLDPTHPTSELMISWEAADGWEHRAYWGADQIVRGSGQGHYFAGQLPAAGGWVRLEVPASAVGLVGANVSGMGFALYNGAASWNKTGTFNGTAASAGSTVASVTLGTTGGSSSSGTTTSGSTPPPAPSATDTLWIDDALPAGAGGLGTSGGDTWNWVGSNPTPYSGSKAHRSDLASGLHEHWFGWSNAPLAINTGDTLISYVYLDPANQPSEIMISWETASGWEHRAYWGADKIVRGSGQGHYNAGALPAAGQWVRLEIPASAVGLEGSSVIAMGYALYDGAATWDASGKSSTSSASTSGSVSSGPSSGSSGSTASTSSSGTTTSSSGSGSTSAPSGSTTGSTSGSSSANSGASSSAAMSDPLRFPQVGDYQLRVIAPTVLELQRVTTKQPDPAPFTDWNFVDGSGNFTAPATSEFNVKVGGNTVAVSSVAFKRRVGYAPEHVYDLRIDNRLYLTLATPVADGQTVQVTNPDSSLWPSSMNFEVTADPLRYSPAIHVNQEGYVPSMTKTGMLGYYLGSGGELAIDASHGFTLVDANSGAVVYSGTLTQRSDVGYGTTPLPYQTVYQADFTSFKTPGTYRLQVAGLGASLPFMINDGVAMAVARTYALGLYHQRSGMANALPYTRFTHGADHTAPALIPTSDSQFDFTWHVIASYSGGNSSQTAPVLNGPSTQLYPFVNQGQVDVSGGHFDAGDYSKYTTNVAQLVHLLMFNADNIKGAAALDNLGIPESGDGISDIMQEAKWEADYLSKLQDADGGFYFIVYPKTREYEGDVQPDQGDQQVVWPKNTSCTAAAVAALAQCASSPLFKQTYPDAAAKYLSQAKLGWQFLMNAQAKYGKAGAYQKITFYGDRWNDNDELAWAACEMFLATGDQQYAQLLQSWFPDPSDPNTFRDNYVRMAECWGNAIRDYAFGARSGRVAASALNATYLAACENQIKLAGQDALTWSTHGAYGTDFSDPSKRFMAAGWYYSLDWACDMAVAYQIDPQQPYLDALVGNENYELGCNPVNVSFLSGLGQYRQHEYVSQYANTDRRLLPPDGFIVGHIVDSFSWVGIYGTTRTTVSFPADNRDGASTPLQDRWSDTWNTSAEMVTVNLGRSMLAAATLATQTTSASVPWKVTSAVSIVAPASASVGQSASLSINSAGLDLTGAHVTWEAQDQQPNVGATFNITPQTSGTNWAEVEIEWPDGRRMFGATTYNVQ